MAEYYDNDGGDGTEQGMPVVPVFPFPEALDFEWLIMSLPSDHAKIVLIRHFGLRGKTAAKAAGFSSEWSLYRREHELKKDLQRKRAHYFG
jgi:hypothetical protein